MELPKDSDVVLLLCEDARLEVGNKITLLGMYAGDDISVWSEEDEKNIGALTFVILIKGKSGKFRAVFEIRKPDKSSFIRHEFGDIEKPAAGAAVPILKFSPFFVEQYGEYLVILSLDGREYIRAFTIRKGEGAAPR